MAPATATEIQTAILKVLSDPNGRKLYWLERGYAECQRELMELIGGEKRIIKRLVDEVVWSLIRQGLVYINFADNSSDNWYLRLTEIGEAAADDELSGPDNQSRFLERFVEKVPERSDVVMQYVRESVTAYVSGCYLASSVMIGVASEAAFLEMASAFARWLPPESGTRLLGILDDSNSGIAKRYREVRNKLHPYLGGELKDTFENVDVDLNGVFDLLRSYRNDAGHPRKRNTILRDDVFDHHRMLINYLQKLYRMKMYFEETPRVDEAATSS